MRAAAQKNDQRTPPSPADRERFINQLNDFRGSIELLKDLMAEMESAYQRAQGAARSKLQEQDRMLQEKDRMLHELEKDLTEKIQQLESHVNEKENLLQTRDRELDTLRSEVKLLTGRQAELESAYERAELLRQNELRRREETVQVRDSAARELKENLTGKIRDLGSRLSDKEELLTSREQELEALRLEVKSLTGRLTESESAYRRSESLLQDEIRKKEEILQVKNSVARIRELKETLAKAQSRSESPANEKKDTDPFEILLNKRV